MRYKFDIVLNDNDYLELNMFIAVKSVYGKKTSFLTKIFILLIGAAVGLIGFINDGIKVGSVGCAAICLLFVFLVVCFYDKFMRLVFKLQMKMLKGVGKSGYDPESVMEFYDDSFTETTPNQKSVRSYSSVERISIVGEKTIYIHVNSVGGYTLPYSCFESKEQYEEFIDFLKTKCNSVDYY